MTEQEIYLERYDWTVHVMYDVHSKDSMNVRRHLRDLGCSGIPLEDACNLVLKGEPNKGITYSNVDTRKTVVVIGWTSTKAEYMNSLSHEMLHVVQHISEHFLINMYGEEVCYLLGGLVQACSIRKGRIFRLTLLLYLYMLLSILWFLIHKVMLIYVSLGF